MAYATTAIEFNCEILTKAPILKTRQIVCRASPMACVPVREHRRVQDFTMKGVRGVDQKFSKGAWAGLRSGSGRRSPKSWNEVWN